MVAGAVVAFGLLVGALAGACDCASRCGAWHASLRACGSADDRWVCARRALGEQPFACPIRTVTVSVPEWEVQP